MQFYGTLNRFVGQSWDDTVIVDERQRDGITGWLHIDKARSSLEGLAYVDSGGLRP